MYIYTHIHTHKTFFYAISKFYFVIKRRRETQNGNLTLRAACNKQLPVCLAASIRRRPHLALALGRAYTAIFNN